MKDRIDPLIAERAPWLFAGKPGSALARALLMRVLGYDRTLVLGAYLGKRSSRQIMGALSALLARNLECGGLSNVPRQGPALFVANHPTGIADGIILHSVISAFRPDLFIFANSDILRVLPQMSDMIIPVEWRPERRSHSKARETMALTRRAVAEGRPGLIFPAGRLAKRRGLRLHERTWMASAAMISRRFGLPVVPINIRARNSALFYLFDMLHPTLRDITLFHETLNKSRQPFRVTVGEPISAGALPRRSEDGIALLRQATLALGDPGSSSVSLIHATRSLSRNAN